MLDVYDQHSRERDGQPAVVVNASSHRRSDDYDRGLTISLPLYSLFSLSQTDTLKLSKQDNYTSVHHYITWLFFRATLERAWLWQSLPIFPAPV
jgi:hypothetical protein